MKLKKLFKLKDLKPFMQLLKQKNLKLFKLKDLKLFMQLFKQKDLQQ